MTNPTVTGLIVFGCTFGGALLGMVIRAGVPEQHVGGESKDIIKLSIGLVGTMTALVVGLLIASAKGTYDSERGELTQMSARIVLLDVVLANYGPQAQAARDLLRVSVARVIDRIWPKKTEHAQRNWTRRQRAPNRSTNFFCNSRPRTRHRRRSRPRR